MEKIKVEICVGTTCHILGASELQHLENFFSRENLEKLDITGVACLGACKNDNYGNAPFVRINGKIIGNANIHSLIEHINGLINGGDENNAGS
jgi:NADH:ubiquinone oxidoreductase subunit E